MDWINLHIPSVIRSAEFIGSSPAERGTWLCVLAYACSIECGGRLTGAAHWKDRQWQQACGVTMREIRAADRLLQVDGDDIVVNGYPAKKESQVRSARKTAVAGAMARWAKTPAHGTPSRHDERHAERHQNGIAESHADEMPTGIGKRNAEGEGEGEGEGERHAHADADAEQQARSLGTWIRWRSKDRQREAEQFQETVDLVRTYGAKAVQEAAARIAHRENRKAWSDELLPELTRAIAPAKPQTPQEIAQRIIAKHGWEACRDASEIPAIRTAAAMEMALADDGYIRERVLTKLGQT